MRLFENIEMLINTLEHDDNGKISNNHVSTTVNDSVISQINVNCGLQLLLLYV